jgi:hypothetical protein
MKNFFSNFKPIVSPLMGGLRGAFFVFLIYSCNSESASDCFQNAGELTRVEVLDINKESLVPSSSSFPTQGEF